MVGKDWQYYIQINRRLTINNIEAIIKYELNFYNKKLTIAHNQRILQGKETIEEAELVEMDVLEVVDEEASDGIKRIGLARRNAQKSLVWKIFDKIPAKTCDN